MRTLAQLFVIFSFLFCASANAQECSTVTHGRFASGYIYKTFRAEASADPVVQGGGTITCGHWSYDGWASAGTAGGLANEWDAAVIYDTASGPFRVQLAAAYFGVNLDDSLLEAYDDMIELDAEVNYPMTWDRLTLAPLVRVTHVIGVDELPSATLIQPGVRASYRLGERFTAHLDVRESVNLTTDESGIRFDSMLAWQASDRTTIRFGFEGTDRTRSVFSIGFVRR